MTDQRPFAAQARALCPETNHDEVWFCTQCRMIEQRLTPIHMVPGFAELLADAAIVWPTPSDG